MTTKELAWRIRRNALDMARITKLPHTVCVFSLAEIFAVLFNDIMQIYPDNPTNDNRDRFILSEGHCCVTLGAVLAEIGYFPKDDLFNKYPDGGKLTNNLYPGGVPGIEFATATLGVGLSVACGMAYTAKKAGKTHRIYCVVGDGECNEGSIWEAALFAGHHKLSNLTVIVNNNKIQGQDRNEKILSLANIFKMWESFGFYVLETDGHDVTQLKETIMTTSDKKPICVIAHTTKGKGVSFMEDNVLWHYLYADGEQYDTAIKELEATRS